MSALWTQLSGRLRFFFGFVALDIFTLRIIAAGQKGTVTPFLCHHLASAFRADLLYSVFILILSFGITAFREVDTGNKFTETADTIYEIVAAIRTFVTGTLQLLLFHIFIGILQQWFKFIVEGTNLLNIVSFTCRNLIQMMLHVSSIGYVDDAAEKLLQLGISQFPLLARYEHLGLAALTWTFQRNIATGLQCIDDNCIRGRTADALFLQILNQTRLTVA